MNQQASITDVRGRPEVSAAALPVTPDATRKKQLTPDVEDIGVNIAKIFPVEMIEKFIGDFNDYYRSKLTAKEFQKRIKIQRQRHQYEDDFGDFHTRTTKYNVVVPYKTAVSFHLDGYPYCCAMTSLHNFSMASGLVSDEFIFAGINELIRLYRTTRVVVAIPEYREDIGFSSTWNSPPSKDETDEANMNYPLMYQWAKSMPHFQEMLFTNHNTNRIIHLCEVVVHNQD